MRDGRSLTSDLVAAVRAFYSACPEDLDTVHDPLAEQLLPRGLTLPARLARGVPGFGRMAHYIGGALSLGLAYVVPLRTKAIDEALVSELRRGTDQLVILGAGLDSRAWRLEALSDCIVYEVDHPETQRFKRSGIARCDLSCDRLVFCAIDFERESIRSVLEAEGFEASRPTFWIWEGVTMYLTREALEATMDAIAELSAPGSVVACTYLPAEVMQHPVHSLGGSLFSAVGEPLLGAMEPQELARVLGERGLQVEADDGVVEWAARYWANGRGRFARSFERLVVARASR